MSFINIERVYSRDEDVYVGTSSGDALLVARLLSDEQVEQSLMSILQALSADSEKENDTD